MSLGQIGSLIPAEWETPLLTDLVSPKQWKTIATKSLIDEGYVVYGANGKIGFYSEYTHEKPTLMITCRGATCGNLHISEPYSYINGNAMALDEQPTELVSLSYLRSALEARGLTDVISGSAQPQITRQGLNDVRLPLPPLAEQKVIAEKLDSLLAQVESTKARLEHLPEILKRFRQSVLAAAVSGRLTEEWRESRVSLSPISLDEIAEYWTQQYQKIGKNASKNKLSRLDSPSSVPVSWVDTQIGSVFDVYVGATPKRKEPEFWSGEIPWVSSSEVAFCRVKSTKETITSLGLKNTSTNLHPRGTVMLAMIGQGKTRGQVAILDIEACHNQNTAALRIPDGFAKPEFLYFYLMQQYEETRRVGGGNNQQALNKAVVQSLRFPLPPIEEQTEIVRRVEELFAYADKIQQQADAALQRVNSLTQSILAKAFRGELTADWRAANPGLITGDNAAEALLEKIKAERAAQKPKKKTRTKKTA